MDFDLVALTAALKSSAAGAHEAVSRWRAAVGTTHVAAHREALEQCRERVGDDFPGTLVALSLRGARAGADCPKEVAVLLMEAAAVGKELFSMRKEMVALEASLDKLVDEADGEVDIDEAIHLQYQVLTPTEALIARLLLVMRIAGFNVL